MSNYDRFAEVYDRLMDDVDYKARTDYLLSLFEKHDRRPTLPPAPATAPKRHELNGVALAAGEQFLSGDVRQRRELLGATAHVAG